VKLRGEFGNARDAHRAVAVQGAVIFGHRPEGHSPWSRHRGMVRGCGNDRPAASTAAPGTKPAAMPTDFIRPVVDRNTPFPPLSGAVLDALALQAPELASRRESILAAESAAIQGVLDSRRGKATPSERKGKVAPRHPQDSWARSSTAGPFGPRRGLHHGPGHELRRRTQLRAAPRTAAPTGHVRDGPGRRKETVEGGRVVASTSTAIENGRPVATLETRSTCRSTIVDATRRSRSWAAYVPRPTAGRFTLKLGANGHAGRGSATTTTRTWRSRFRCRSMTRRRSPIRDST